MEVLNLKVVCVFKCFGGVGFFMIDIEENLRMVLCFDIGGEF